MLHVIPLHWDDPRLEPYRELPRRNLTALSGRFIVEGKWLVERLIVSGYDVESILVEERRWELLPAELCDNIPVFSLPARDIEQLIGFHFHRGILACGRRRPARSVQEMMIPPGPLLMVACLDIHDPTNLGGILRNCAAFGVQGVLLSRNCADPFSRRVLRVSMGTAFRLSLASLNDPVADLSYLRVHFNSELVASVLSDDAEHLSETRRPQRMILLIGNEGHGVPPACLDCSDRRVTLPMAAGVDSLNAAAACAVFLYQFTRETSWS
jgi:tRNA G18 (ribose-2'-O)-methylase SpoU